MAQLINNNNVDIVFDGNWFNEDGVLKFHFRNANVHCIIINNNIPNIVPIKYGSASIHDAFGDLKTVMPGRLIIPVGTQIDGVYYGDAFIKNNIPIGQIGIRYSIGNGNTRNSTLCFVDFHTR